MFIGLLAYQASATIERIRSAFLGVERYVINRTSNPAFDAAHPLAGVPEWLDPVSSPLHTSPVTSYLDGSELQQAFWYFWSRWHTAIVADVALLVAAILVFSTLRNEPKSDADVSGARLDFLPTRR